MPDAEAEREQVAPIKSYPNLRIIRGFGWLMGRKLLISNRTRSPDPALCRSADVVGGGNEKALGLMPEGSRSE